jgi:hypothetical protein
MAVSSAGPPSSRTVARRTVCADQYRRGCGSPESTGTAAATVARSPCGCPSMVQGDSTVACGGAVGDQQSQSTGQRLL